METLLELEELDTCYAVLSMITASRSVVLRKESASALARLGQFFPQNGLTFGHYPLQNHVSDDRTHVWKPGIRGRLPHEFLVLNYIRILFLVLGDVLHRFKMASFFSPMMPMMPRPSLHATRCRSVEFD